MLIVWTMLPAGDTCYQELALALGQVCRILLVELETIANIWSGRHDVGIVPNPRFQLEKRSLTSFSHWLSLCFDPLLLSCIFHLASYQSQSLAVSWSRWSPVALVSERGQHAPRRLHLCHFNARSIQYLGLLARPTVKE